jgi:hypothetical protein
MSKILPPIVFALFSLALAGNANAQISIPIGHYLLPSNPTSADNLKLSMNRPCSTLLPYKANSYQVTMSQNNITVTRGEIVGGIVPSSCPPSPRDEIDLGRLPAGNYTLTVINAFQANAPSSPEFSNFPITVIDARAAKVTPFVKLDYSGHWWDPNDSGWGLFIWHDARDNVLAAWFTYTPDGKPMWYVFQPRWQTASSTFSADLIQTSRPVGATSPPPGLTSTQVVGSASLDFTNFNLGDEGKITYAFGSGPTLVRNIQRFKP